MAKTIKAWLLNADGLGDDFYSAYDLVYRGRYSIQKLLTNNELKYAVTEEYTYRESDDIRDRQYYVFISGTPDDMSLRYLYCTGYVYRFRSSAETNLLYETDVLLYVADDGKSLSVLEIIPNEGVDSTEIPDEPPVPYRSLYSEDITGIEQNTIIRFIIANPFTSGEDTDDGTLLAIDTRYYFSSEEERDKYFATHPMELARSPLLVAVQSSGNSNEYILYRYYRSEDQWENINTVIAGPRGEPGAHAVMLEGTTETLAPGESAYVRVNVITGEDSSDSDEDSDDTVAYRLDFGIPQGVKGNRGPRGHRPEVGNVDTVQVDYSYPAKVTITETAEISDDSDEHSVLDFTFQIPQGDVGLSPFISGGYWYSYDSSHHEYRTNTRARGATAPCPIISNGNWYVNQDTGLYDSDSDPIFSWIDTDVRAYGNNFLVISDPIYEGVNTFNLSVFTAAGYTADEVTLNSLVVSTHKMTRNYYGQITAVDETSGTKILYVTYKGTAQGDVSVREFNAGKAYSQGSLCMYNGILYRAYSDIEAGNFNPDQWEQVLNNNTSPLIKDFESAAGNRLPLYQKDVAAVASNTLYKCTVYGFPDEYFDNGIFQYQFDTEGPVIWWDPKTAAAWESETGYLQGDFMSYNGDIYRCIADHISDSEFSSAEQAYWTLCSAFAANTQYHRGDAVVYNSKPYVCINDCLQSVFQSDNLYWYPIRIPVFYNQNDPVAELPDDGDYVYTSLDAGQDNVYKVTIEKVMDSSSSGLPVSRVNVVLDQVLDPNGAPVMMSDTWTSGTAYSAGDHVIYSGMLYFCQSANTQSAFSMYYSMPNGLSVVWKTVSDSTVYSGGPGITVSGSEISVRIDSSTMGFDSSGALTCSGGTVTSLYGSNGITVSSSGGSTFIEPNSGLLAAVTQVDSYTHQVHGSDAIDKATIELIHGGLLATAEDHIGSSAISSANLDLNGRLFHIDSYDLVSSSYKELRFGTSGFVVVDNYFNAASHIVTTTLEFNDSGLYVNSGQVLDAGNLSNFVDSATIVVNSSGQLACIAGSGGVVVDSALSSSSTNPVQNQVIYSAIGDLESLLSSI